MAGGEISKRLLYLPTEQGWVILFDLHCATQPIRKQFVILDGLAIFGCSSNKVPSLAWRGLG
jgi:hypothetical protein